MIWIPRRYPLNLLPLLRQPERENILQRQAEGIAAAKASGVVFGRKKPDRPQNLKVIFTRWRSKAISGEQAAELCCFSVRALYNKTAEGRPKTRFSGVRLPWCHRRLILLLQLGLNRRQRHHADNILPGTAAG